MSRPSRHVLPTNTRERLAYDFTRAAPLRDLYPQLAEVRVEFEFQDGTLRAPSPQAFSYFPAARGFFRYACPCHSCSGEFDISSHVAELAAKADKPQRNRRLNLTCPGNAPWTSTSVWHAPSAPAFASALPSAHRSSQ